MKPDRFGISYECSHLGVLYGQGIGFTLHSAFALVLMLLPPPVNAQTVVHTFEELRGQLKRGDTVWVTDETKRESRGRIVDLAESALVLTTDQGRREVPVHNIIRLRQRRPDSVLNGALIGGAAALAPIILWFAPQTETGETAGENVGFIALMVGIGAGAGAGIDALIEGRKTIYLAPFNSTAGVRISPMLSRDVRGSALLAVVLKRDPWNATFRKPLNAI